MWSEIGTFSAENGAHVSGQLRGQCGFDPEIEWKFITGNRNLGRLMTDKMEMWCIRSKLLSR